VITKRIGPTTEASPLAEHLFRYGRGGFWVGAFAFKYFEMPFNELTRWLLDDFLDARMMYTALHASEQSKSYVVRYLALPNYKQYMNYTDKAFGIYPLWLCRLRQSSIPTMHPHLKQTEADGKAGKPMLSVGLWGFGLSQYEDPIKTKGDFEDKFRKLGGIESLYAHTYHTEEEAWKIYDREWDDALRKKYDATSLPSVYEKVKVNVEMGNSAASPSFVSLLLERWPVDGFYGIRKAIDSGAHLQTRNSA
jgi:delta24-sterol reductase